MVVQGRYRRGLTIKHHKRMRSADKQNPDKVDDNDMKFEQAEHQEISRPPFPSIPSFHINIVILRFLGFYHEIKMLLHLLSHNTEKYYRGHREILGAYIKSERLISGELNFGEQRFRYDHKFPNELQLKQLMRNNNMKLSAIHYKAWLDNSSLCGIQLEFMNGV